MTSLLHRLTLLASLTFAASLTGCAADEDDANDAAEGESVDVEDSEDALRNHRIVPGVSIGGVKLGMTASEVRSRLGKPKRALDYTGGQVALYEYVEMSVAFSSAGRVERIFTQLGPWTTKSGVGIASPYKEVDALPGTSCRISRVDDELTTYWPGCVISSGRAETEFHFGKVSGPKADLTTSRVTQVSLVAR